MYRKFFKRVIDILGQRVWNTISISFFVILALAIKLDPKRSCFFLSKKDWEREAKLFKIIKFRTMV